MLYHHLFKNSPKKDDVLVAVVGAGHFGTAVVTQQKHTSQLKVCVVADKNLESAKEAYIKAQIEENLIVYSNDPIEANTFINEGKFVYTDNALMVAEIPCINVVAEGTGVPEVSAEICLKSIKNGKKVAAISKEMDSVVGPILKKKAKEMGTIYSPVDGDQPALLMALVEWAKAIGLTVISAGKARDGEFILDESAQTVSIKADGITVHEDCVANIPNDYMKYFQMIPEGKADEYIAKRKEILNVLPGTGAFDLCELTMMANATGLKPVSPYLTEGSLRITELPIAYCGKKNSGIYDEEGMIDVHTNLRRYDESGMGGGVFMVVKCDNAYSNYILTTKGQIPNYDLSTAVIYRPYHLCGVETSTTLLSMELLGLDTGTVSYVPNYDLVKTALVDIKCGDILGNDHDLRLKASIIPSTVKGAKNPIPAHMISGNIATKDIKAGEIITYEMVADRSETTLWSLRLEQEEFFKR
ncbi:MAG: flagellar biosynthesis protein FlgA [Lachnospiraceae bacterium]|nr:flagellar biosynthesis protein FlgA [Lachnospiraceae bacterium]